MKVQAKLNYLRIAPRKVRQVSDLIRRKPVQEAKTILNFTIKKANSPLLKLLNQAVANAKNNFQLEESNLYIDKITVDEGPKYKRWRARARGRAAEIQKKTSHITIILDEFKKTKRKPKKAKVQAVEKPLIREEDEKKEVPSAEKPKFREPKSETKRPKTGAGLRKFFRRKAF